MSPTGKQRIDPSQYHKILLIRLKRIGDIIMTTPAVTALKKALPHAALSYVVEKPYRELVEGNSYLDNVFILDKKEGSKGFLKLLRLIRRERFDALIDFHGGPTASLLTLFSRAGLKVGYKTKYKNFIYHIKLPRRGEGGPIHSVENHLNLVRALGIKAEEETLRFPAASAIQAQRVQEFIEKNDLMEAKIVLIHIGAGNEFRDWGYGNIVKLIGLLGRHPEIQAVLIGSKDDAEAEMKILSASSAHVKTLVGKLSLAELRELIDRTALFFGADSGPMHVAATTATPIVALFGPTLPANFSPWKANAAILEQDLHCRPCKQRKCIYEDFRCLQRIEPEEAYRACLGFLNL